jgi:hypothetical protein
MQLSVCTHGLAHTGAPQPAKAPAGTRSSPNSEDMMSFFMATLQLMIKWLCTFVLSANHKPTQANLNDRLKGLLLSCPEKVSAEILPG